MKKKHAIKIFFHKYAPSISSFINEKQAALWNWRFTTREDEKKNGKEKKKSMIWNKTWFLTKGNNNH